MFTRAAGIAVACLALASASSCAADGVEEAAAPGLRMSAIPDQDPASLVLREEALADYLAEELDVQVEFVPVTDYAASVTLFRTGGLDLVFYGGLTGVQARLSSEGAEVLAQRDIDAEFRSVFIAHADAGLEPFEEVSGLAVLAGRRFTFGSESSTSGRLMPEFFLGQAGVRAEELAGEPGFSGSHDATINLVEAGSYEAGAVNGQVWDARVEAGTVDLDRVVELFRTPRYHDYHWLSGPGVDDRLGPGFTERLRTALLGLDGSDQREQRVLSGYGAQRLIPSTPSNYAQIELVARELGLVT